MVVEYAAKPSGDSSLPVLAHAYRAEHRFVRRSLMHLGVSPPFVDDALQDVFLVVIRRLSSYTGPSMRNWLYGIARRIASEYRRGTRRTIRSLPVIADPDAHPATASLSSRLAAASAVRRFLTELDEDKREVFVLTEVEGMTAREISEQLEVNVNTVSGRLRAARRLFVRAVARDSASERMRAIR